MKNILVLRAMALLCLVAGFQAKSRSSDAFYELPEDRFLLLGPAVRGSAMQGRRGQDLPGQTNVDIEVTTQAAEEAPPEEVTLEPAEGYSAPAPVLGQPGPINDISPINQPPDMVVDDPTAPPKLQASGMVAQGQYDQYGAMVVTPQQAAAYTGPNLVYPQNMVQQPVAYQPQPVAYQPQAPPRPTNVRVSPITYDDVDTLLNILDAINTLYNYYYQILPDQTNSTASHDDKGDAKKHHLMAVMVFYSRIRSFVHTVVYNQYNLFGDLNFFEAKTDTLSSTTDEMLRFYGFQFKYYQLKTDAAQYMNTTGNAINEQFDVVKKVNAEFDIDVKNILAGAFDLARLHEYFQAQIVALQTVSYQDNLINALDKFDKVVMFVVRLVEIKMDVQKSLAETERSLVNIQGYRGDLEKAMMTIQKLVEKEAAAAAKKSAELFPLLLALVFALLFAA